MNHIRELKGQLHKFYKCYHEENFIHGVFFTVAFSYMVSLIVSIKK